MKWQLKDCSSYTVYLAWLQSSTRELWWLEYLKSVFLKIPNVTNWLVFQNQVTYTLLIKPNTEYNNEHYMNKNKCNTEFQSHRCTYLEYRFSGPFYSVKFPYYCLFCSMVELSHHRPKLQTKTWEIHKNMGNSQSKTKLESPFFMIAFQ